MSILADTTSMLSGCLVASIYPGLGAPASAIIAASSGGDSGAGPLVGLGLVDGTDYYWAVTTPPASGSLQIYEDGSFSHTGAADGVWLWSAGVYAEGVLQWSLTITDAVGAAMPAVVVASTGPQPYAQRLGEGPLYPSPKNAAKGWLAMLKKITSQAGVK